MKQSVVSAAFHLHTVIAAVGPTSLTVSNASPIAARGTNQFSSGTPNLTNVSVDVGTLAVGMAITGPGIRDETTIAALGPGTITLSDGVTPEPASDLTQEPFTAGSTEITSASADCGSFARGAGNFRRRSPGRD